MSVQTRALHERVHSIWKLRISRHFSWQWMNCPNVPDVCVDNSLTLWQKSPMTSWPSGQAVSGLFISARLVVPEGPQPNFMQQASVFPECSCSSHWDSAATEDQRDKVVGPGPPTPSRPNPEP